MRLRHGVLSDLASITSIYNYYVRNTAITFDLKEFKPEEREVWFAQFKPTGRYQLFVAEDSGKLLGFSYSYQFRVRPAYDPTVEVGLYLDPEHRSRGLGTLLYRQLLSVLRAEDVVTVVAGTVAGIALPNEASVRLHNRLGFTRVGVFPQVGRKFDRHWDVAFYTLSLRTVPAAPLTHADGSAVTADRPLLPPAHTQARL